jgi:fido (protein-threonine AMPylation protein)
MTDTRQDEPRPGFNLRTIGPEPSGATPLEPEDLEGLIPDFVATRADLNLVEFENITKALPWALRRARALGPEGVLAYGFMTELHRRMFGDVWTWAGTARRRETNIGIAPQLIPTRSMQTLDDATRLMADLYLTSIGARPFTWGGTSLDVDGSGRAEYISALVEAINTDSYADLVQFARRA